MNIMQRAKDNMRAANQILEDLELLKLWDEAGGEPIIVGATAYELIIDPDIDMEIYCNEPDASIGFRVLEQCVRNPRVIKARYSNHLDDEDQGIYYRIDYRHDDGAVWKFDMWLMAHDHPGPCARDLVEPLQEALTEEHRVSILTLKEQLRSQPHKNLPSIHIYEAVVDYGVRTLAELEEWCGQHDRDGLTFWKPRNYSA